MAFTKLHLYFDDVAVDQEWESLARTVTEADVVNFAGVSGDFSPIHVDHEYAKTTAYHVPIAHGLLVFSISSGLALFAPPMRTLAFSGIRDWQFKGPVFIGDTIRVRTRVREKETRARGRRGQIVWQRTVVNQQNQIVQEGATVTLVQGRAGEAGDEGGETV
jgi:acyl dehydratase